MKTVSRQRVFTYFALFSFLQNIQYNINHCFVENNIFEKRLKKYSLRYKANCKVVLQVTSLLVIHIHK